MIGLWALALIFLIPQANRLFAVFMGVEPSAGFQWLVSFMFPFLLLLPATFAMGGTLPVMHRLFNSLGEKKKIIGGLYAANTFGAVAGTLLVVLVLVPRFGHTATLSLLAFCNLFCALGAAMVARTGANPRPP